MKVTILGSGSAAGVPSVSSGWGKCDPKNPKNRRRRASILVEEGPTSILVDTSPDLREQMLSANIRRLDAVLFTHAHADHIHGIDELREITRLLQGPLAAYGMAETMQLLEERFPYIFLGIPEGKPVFRPWLVPNSITPPEKLTVGNITVGSFLQDHGFGNITVGYIFGGLIYSTDVVSLSDAAKDMIRGTKVWIVDCLSDAPYATHAHVEMTLEWIAELKPQRAILTHMSNALDYDRLVAHLPVGVTPAFDGMQIEI